jgi:hypothetical protein
MKEKIVTRNGKTAVARVPENQDILSLQVGSMAPNPWGGMARVDRITHRGISPSGAQYIGYYTKEAGPGKAWISNSICAGKLIRTAPLTDLLTSAECDAIEQDMNA